jgi:predicted CoA-binding protein
VVAVNPKAATVDGDPCYADLASVPGDVEGVIVMVPKDRSAEVVRACAARGVQRVWLFQGIGGPGSVSDEAVQVCKDEGIAVVAGACPMMFLEPVGWFHRAHRTVRRMKGAIGSETAVAAAPQA